jgi:hypothetical protein
MKQALDNGHDPKIQAVIDKYYPCDPKDELKAAAKVFVELNDARPMILVRGFHWGYSKARQAIETLEELGIVDQLQKIKDGSHRRKVLVKLSEVDAIIDNHGGIQNG